MESFKLVNNAELLLIKKMSKMYFSNFLVYTQIT